MGRPALPNESPLLKNFITPTLDPTSLSDSGQRRRHQFIACSGLLSPHPRKIGLQACETAVASEPVEAASSHQASRFFAPLGATVSLRTCSPCQASFGQDWKGAGIVGRWLGTSSLVRAVDAWKLIAILGRWAAARVVRSSPAFCHDH